MGAALEQSESQQTVRILTIYRMQSLSDEC